MNHDTNTDKLMTFFGFDLDRQWDYENGFYLTSHVMRIGKLIAHYELYKSILSLPGQIVECGVYKGSSIIQFATFRELLESSFSRKIIGFDAFGKFPRQQRPDDTQFIERFENEGGDGIPIEELQSVFANKSIQNYELIKGDICETVPQYVVDHPELKISLLHIDVDVYKPTVVILSELYDRIVKGGLVVFDDYGTVKGETDAIDEYLDGKSVHVEKLTVSHVSAFVRKA